MESQDYEMVPVINVEDMTKLWPNPFIFQSCMPQNTHFSDMRVKPGPPHS